MRDRRSENDRAAACHSGRPGGRGRSSVGRDGVSSRPRGRSVGLHRDGLPDTQPAGSAESRPKTRFQGQFLAFRNQFAPPPSSDRYRDRGRSSNFKTIGSKRSNAKLRANWVSIWSTTRWSSMAASAKSDAPGCAPVGGPGCGCRAAVVRAFEGMSASGAGYDSALSVALRVFAASPPPRSKSAPANLSVTLGLARKAFTKHP